MYIDIRNINDMTDESNTNTSQLLVTYNKFSSTELTLAAVANAKLFSHDEKMPNVSPCVLLQRALVARVKLQRGPLWRSEPHAKHISRGPSH